MSNGTPITIRDGSCKILVDKKLNDKGNHGGKNEYEHPDGNKIGSVVIKKDGVVIRTESFSATEMCEVNVHWL